MNQNPQAGGIASNFETHTKPLRAGIASQACVLATELAGTVVPPTPMLWTLPWVSTVWWPAGIWTEWTTRPPSRIWAQDTSPTPGP